MSDYKTNPPNYAERITKKSILAAKKTGKGNREKKSSRGERKALETAL